MFDRQGTAMELRLLGPVEVRAGGRVLPAGRPQQVTVLAVLAVDVGRPVPLDVLVDRVWDQAPPRRARRNLHTHISRIRRLLALADDVEPVQLMRGSSGYVLKVDRDRVDLHRFRHLVHRARDAGCADHDRVALLREALGLWRGEPLAGLPGEWAQRMRKGWRQQWLETLVGWAQAELLAGRPDLVISRLTGLVDEYPLVEPLAAELMRALHAAGRTAEALSCYTAVRERLVEQLGVDPGPQLRAVHHAILRGEPATVDRAQKPAAPIPAQLPMDVPGFTGRETELARLDASLAGLADAPTAVVVSAVSGTAGVGKTALAVHWAHRVADRFPDGQLYVDLRGYGATEPLRPIDALAQLLHALGAPADRVPVDTDEAAALYRSLLAGRRMLVVLDNAATAEQIRPLLPGHGCVVLVTSRDRLTGLAARDGAHCLAVDVLTEPDAMALLRRLLGAELTDAEPEAARQLALDCARLPLALRIAAANLASGPYDSVSSYLAELRTAGTLAGLSADSDDRAAVGAAFGHSYRRLTVEARLVFRRLGLVPGPELTAGAAAALVGAGEEEVRPILRQLAAVHLVAPVTVGRYTFHDLLRQYAKQRALADDGEAACAAAVDRLYQWYLSWVDAAARHLYANKVRLPLPVTVSPAVFPDPAAALAWLEAERPNLVAAVRQAAEHGPRPAAWRLADALRGFFWMRVYLVDWLAVARVGLAAAAQDGDAMARAAGHLNLASVHLRQNRYRQAIAHHRRCVALAERARWWTAMAGALSNIGSAYRQLGDNDEAVSHHLRALDIRRRIGDTIGQASVLDNLGNSYHELGELERAVDHHEQAVAIYRAVGNRQAEAVAIINLADSQLALGRPADALRLLRRALVIHREVGDRGGESENLRIQAEVHRAQGRYEQAREAVDAALAIARDTGDLRFEADALNTAGAIHCQLGAPAVAIDHHTRALHLARKTRSRSPEALALIGLAGAYRQLGRHGQAARRAQAALTLAERYRLRNLAEMARPLAPSALGR